MLKVVWRFNLKDGVDEADFFHWMRHSIWSSSAKYGCATTAFRLEYGSHQYAVESAWPSAAARDAWMMSEEGQALPHYPGTDSTWGAQLDLEGVVHHPLE